jgi:hypothetical protein
MSDTLWGVTSDDMRNSVQRFFLPTKDVNLVRKSRTKEMEPDMWLAIVVWLVCVYGLYTIVIKPFLEKRRAGFTIVEEGEEEIDPDARKQQ